MDYSVSFDNSDFTDVKQAETKIAAQALHSLATAYKGYEWFVEVSFETGLCTVRPEFGGQYGFVLHLNLFASSSEFEKAVVWAGGEMLERYNLSRERASQSAIENLTLDARGFAVGDRSK